MKWQARFQPSRVTWSLLWLFYSRLCHSVLPALRCVRVRVGKKRKTIIGLEQLNIEQLCNLMVPFVALVHISYRRALGASYRTLRSYGQRTEHLRVSPVRRVPPTCESRTLHVEGKRDDCATERARAEQAAFPVHRGFLAPHRCWVVRLIRMSCGSRTFALDKLLWGILFETQTLVGRGPAGPLPEPDS